MIIFWFSFFLFVIYLLASLVVYYLQEKIIFWPVPLQPNAIFDFKGDFEEITLEYPLGVKINCLHFKVKNPKGCVLYHHGNADNLMRWGKKYELFTKEGYDVFFYDYRTFGKSKGTLSELALGKDAKRMYEYLKKFYPGDRIVQYGISLGSGVAVKLAEKINCPLLILETPYLSMYHMANHKLPFLLNSVLLKFHIRTDKLIKNVKCPIHVFHGTKDELVPYEQGKVLSEINPLTTFVPVEGAMHNNLEEFKEFRSGLETVLRQF